MLMFKNQLSISYGGGGDDGIGGVKWCNVLLGAVLFFDLINDCLPLL